MGLLSSLSLNTRVSKINIYGPAGLENYILLNSRYSQTSFHYKLYINTVSIGLVSQALTINSYIFARINYLSFMHFDCAIVVAERPGRFNLIKAVKYNLPIGPLFSYLKAGRSFLLPDGCIVYGDHFISDYFLGVKISFSCPYINRSSVEIIRNATCVLYSA